MQQADELRYALIGQLGSTEAKIVSIDLSAIEEADVSLLQLLVSLRLTAQARGIDLAVRSNAYVDALLARGGLARWNDASAPAAAA